MPKVVRTGHRQRSSNQASNVNKGIIINVSVAKVQRAENVKNAYLVDGIDDSLREVKET